MDITIQDGKIQLPNSSFLEEKIEFLLYLSSHSKFVFPLHRMIIIEGKLSCACFRRRSCKSPGKHPAMPWHKPPDPKEPQTQVWIRNHVKQWPDCGWGIHLGLSQIMVVDVDPRNYDMGDRFNLLYTLGIDFDKPQVKTGGGGWHWYLGGGADHDPVLGVKDPGGKRSCCRQFARGVEFLSGQHYVVLPFSPHASGKWYERGAM
jgi:hypothetical protein